MSCAAEGEVPGVAFRGGVGESSDESAMHGKAWDIQLLVGSGRWYGALDSIRPRREW